MADRLYWKIRWCLSNNQVRRNFIERTGLSHLLAKAVERVEL
jgi:hypothetical protein